jgi:hypothetical protein
LRMSSTGRALLAFACVFVLASIALGAGLRGERYPYGSSEFNLLVTESFEEAGYGSAKVFYDWLARACAKRSICPLSGSLETEVRVRGAKLRSVRGQKEEVALQLSTCSWLHRLVKKSIPKFSLDRGFEFHNVVRYGERQCLLQSILIAGLAQKMGLDAGMVMVWRNIAGEESNNGHAAVLVRLADGKDIILDASDQVPFVRHQGLFARASGYRYVSPVYQRGSDKIIGYLANSGHGFISTAKLRPMGVDFIRSQFYYYRGERALGGAIAAKKTSKGLALSERQLKKSVSLCPENPLAVYMLARTYLAEGKKAEAAKLAKDALSLYTRFGYVPGGASDLAGRLRAAKG